MNWCLLVGNCVLVASKAAHPGGETSVADLLSRGRFYVACFADFHCSSLRVRLRVLAAMSPVMVLLRLQFNRDLADFG